MPKIVYGGSAFGQWAPETGEILLPTDPTFREKSPIVFSHEYGHCRYDHLGSSDALTNFVEERDAWRFAISKLPPGEIDLEFIEGCLDGYLEEVRNEMENPKEVELAEKMKRDILDFARRRKGAL